MGNLFILTEQVEAEQAAPDLALVQRRMKDIVTVLENFSTRREEGRSRGDYIQQVWVMIIMIMAAHPSLLLFSVQSWQWEGECAAGAISCHAWESFALFATDVTA
jgi:hypothetical protein